MNTFDRLLQTLDPSRLLGALIIAGILVLCGMVASWSTRRLLKAALDHDRGERVDEITLQFLGHLIVMVIWLILLTFYAHLIPALNRFSTALLAGVSLVSVVLGFAAQTTLGNLIAGVSLVLYKPFRRGDRLQVLAPTEHEFEIGTVQDITLGFTLLRTDDGREIVVANSTMAQQTMIKLPRPGAGPAQGPSAGH